MRAQWNDGASATPAEFGPHRATIQQAIFCFYLFSVHAAWPSVMGVAYRMKIGQLAYAEQHLRKIPDEFREPTSTYDWRAIMERSALTIRSPLSPSILAYRSLPGPDRLKAAAPRGLSCKTISFVKLQAAFNLVGGHSQTPVSARSLKMPRLFTSVRTFALPLRSSDTSRSRRTWNVR
jgi:hypothetical protein